MSSEILQLGRNVWRIEPANRAAVLVDGAAFFGALRRAFLNAERSIFIVGWDIDSRTRLVGDCDPDDGYSPVLAEFLSELVETKPSLEVYILLWDFSVIYAPERELFPRLALQWKTPARVTLCMDDAVPFGSSQHQKLFVVDDALAFSGGLDLTQRRWDTSDHKPSDTDRIDAADCEYPPFHDVQIMVDGPAAQALALLARRRWCNAHGTEPPIAPFGDPWPQNVTPHFTAVDVGIARTEPALDGHKPVKEVETLFLDAIDRAERSIYIENQFMTALPVAKRLARRLRQRRNLEVVAVSPRRYESWIVSQTLGNERSRFLKILRRAGGDRVRVVYPTSDDERTSADTMVHSKVMIVDDRLLRIGSANLNNRSMAVDTECDLAIEAKNDTERAAITDVRNQLIGDHCGVSADVVASEFAAHGSIIKAVDRLSGNGHRLREIDDGGARKSRLAELLKAVVDPKRPLSLVGLWNRLCHVTPPAGTALIVSVLAVIVALTLAWNFTPVSEIATLERVQGVLASAASSAWAPLWVLITYVVAGVVAFPVLILIVATAATFGPWFGFFYALLGVLASALVMYLVGALLGRNLLQSLFGPRWNRVRREIDDRGILAVAAIRLVPIAPFSVVNLAAGALSVTLLDYVAGTLIGMLPGLIAISALGHEITALFTDFSAANVARLLLFALVWIAIVWAMQSLINRARRRTQ